MYQSFLRAVLVSLLIIWLDTLISFRLEEFRGSSAVKCSLFQESKLLDMVPLEYTRLMLKKP